MCGYFDWSILFSAVRDALHGLVEAFAGPRCGAEETFEYRIGVVGKYSLIIHMLSVSEEEY